MLDSSVSLSIDWFWGLVVPDPDVAQLTGSGGIMLLLLFPVLFWLVMPINLSSTLGLSSAQISLTAMPCQPAFLTTLVVLSEYPVRISEFVVQGWERCSFLRSSVISTFLFGSAGLAEELLMLLLLDVGVKFNFNLDIRTPGMMAEFLGLLDFDLGLLFSRFFT